MYQEYLEGLAALAERQRLTADLRNPRSKAYRTAESFRQMGEHYRSIERLSQEEKACLKAREVEAIRRRDRESRRFSSARNGAPVLKEIGPFHRFGAQTRAGTALACQRDNISHIAGKRPKETNNSGYRRRRAFEVEENITYAIACHGQKIARGQGKGQVSLTQGATIGADYALEFTVTIPPAGKLFSAKHFAKVWDQFNRSWMLRQKWIDSWMMVKEIHKSGEVHAHCLLLSWRNVTRPGVRPRWLPRKSGPKRLDGKSVARWLPDIWRKLRSEGRSDGTRRIGILERNGMGSSHTLQPLQCPAAAAKYIAKYLTKGFKADRPFYLRGMRVVAYSKLFPRCCRVFEKRRLERDQRAAVDDFGNAFTTEPRPPVDDFGQERPIFETERITYLPKEFSADDYGFRFAKQSREIVDDFGNECAHPGTPAKRWNMVQTFSFHSSTSIYRRAELAKLARYFGAEDYGDLVKVFGKKWAYYAEPVIGLSEVEDWSELELPVMVYKLRAIGENTDFDALFQSPEGELVTLSELEEKEDAKRKGFTFSWIFRAKADSSICEFVEVLEAITADRRKSWKKLEKEAAKQINSQSGTETRTIERERYQAL